METRTIVPSAAHLLALEPAQLPVLLATREGIAHWAARRDQADANRLADIVLRDPLMVLRTLHHVARVAGGRLASRVQTVTGALVLTGMDPFFREFTRLPVLEEELAHDPQALAGALSAIACAHAAARIAAVFAVCRQDEDAELVHQAALLHGFAGVLLWTHAPQAARQIACTRQREPHLRSAQAQRQVLGIDCAAIEDRLLARWAVELPLRHVPGTPDADNPRLRIVRLALRISRHLQGGWDDAALPDDFEEAAGLLHLSTHAAAALVREAL